MVEYKIDNSLIIIFDKWDIQRSSLEKSWNELYYYDFGSSLNIIRKADMVAYMDDDCNYTILKDRGIGVGIEFIQNEIRYRRLKSILS